MNKQINEKYVEKLVSIKKYSGLDIETAHIEADALLCILLRELGYEDVVEAWERIPKWYA